MTRQPFTAALLVVFLLLNGSAAAEEKLFGGKLVLPTLSGYEFYGSFDRGSEKKRPTYLRWDARPVGDRADRYLFSSSKAGIWLTVSRLQEKPVQGGRLKAPVTAAAFTDNLRKIAAQQKFQLADARTVSFGGGQAGVYQLGNVVPEPYRLILVFLPPAKDSLTAPEGYVLKLVFDKASRAQAQKVLNTVISGARVLP